MNRAQFAELCDEHFGYLVQEFGYTRKVPRVSVNLLQVIYKGRSAAVKVILEWREQYINVEMCKIENGRVAENPWTIGAESTLPCFNLENFLLLRAPESTFPEGVFGRALSIDTMNRVLATYAAALREHGRAILDGDLELFEEMEAMLKARVASRSTRENPP